ncbi:MAG: DHA2 family efflux MFS transporter permease subunit [Oceanospirillaceae bacterium]|nr:DHA2 family efflux MFS transporter permease subunit [Oceanospirillaceae bacterium]
MSTQPDGAAPVTGRTWLAIGAAILGVFMAVLDTQITNASLPEILGSLSASLEEGSWMSTTYLAAEVVAIPLTGFFLRMFGARTFILINTWLFLILSTLCGLAWNLESMIVFRALQGFFGGALIPTAMTLIIVSLPPARRPMALAWLMLASTLAPTLGPTLGGILTELYSWPSIFYINWIPGVLMLAGIAIGLDPQKKHLELLEKLDWLGIAGMIVGLGALIVFLEEGNRKDWFDSDFIRIMALVAFGGILMWLGSQLLRPEPFVNVWLFGRRNFWVSSGVGAAAGVGLYGSTFVLPLFLAQVADYNSRQIGEVIMWMGLPQIIMTPLAAVLAKKIDNRIICTAGLLLFAGSCFMNAFMTAETGYDQLIAAQVLRALGQPLVIIALSNMAIHAIEPANLSSASSLYNMTRVLGGAIGTAVLSTAITMREHLHFDRIGETVTLYSEATRERIATLTAASLQQSGDPALAAQQALASLQAVVRREAYVMAYSDSFFIIGSVLLAAIGLVWLADRIVAPNGKSPGR